MKNFIFLFFVLLFVGKTQAQSYKVACVGFYNLENLFDTINDPHINDEDFLPDGSYSWGTKKYTNKLTNMALVISKIATEVSPDGLALIGVSEVENKAVLEDLVADEQIKDRDYKIVHYDSPDHRGIDVGLLYQEKYFKPTNSVAYPLSFGADSKYTTRDQLLVSGELDGEKVHVIVAHWPSRSGGQSASEPRRIQAAILGRRIIDSLFIVDPAAKIILMGDLNDDPVNKSVKEYIRGKGKMSKVKDGDLFNTTFADFKAGNGTLAWNDAWNLFDQVLISKSLCSEDATSYVYHKSVVYNQDWLKQKEGRFKGYPNRTHAGGQYLNGYSDHFPVYIVLKKQM